jgi:hypothetical protein
VLLSGLVFWVVIATLVGGLVGSRKGRGGLGALLGFLLGWIGVLIIAIMKPSQQFEEQKSIAQAKVLREALGGGLISATAPASTGVVITPEVRQELMLEAIRRDPSLAASSDPETLKCLGETMDALEKEYVLKAELDQLKATQASQAQEAAAVAREQELEAARAQAAAVAAEAARVAADEKASAREAELNEMNPVMRFIRKNPAAALVTLAVLILALAAVIIVPLKGKADERAASRRTACEEDVERTDSLIGTTWVATASSGSFTFNGKCRTGGTGNNLLASRDYSWWRNGSLVQLTASSGAASPRVFQLKLQGESMEIESIDGRAVSNADTRALYTFKRG